jgi:hypothetical protein
MVWISHLYVGYFILGGQFETDRQLDDLKQLYRVYLTEAFAGGRLEDNKVRIQLSTIIRFPNLPIMYLLVAIH